MRGGKKMPPYDRVARGFHHIGPSPMQDVTPNAVAIAERAATTTLMMVLHNIFLESSIMLFF